MKNFDLKNSTFGDRLKYARMHIKISQLEFAKKIGVTSPYVSELEHDKKDPSTQLLIAIEYRHGIRADWLRNGEPPMENSPIFWDFNNLGSLARYLEAMKLFRDREKSSESKSLPDLPRELDSTINHLLTSSQTEVMIEGIIRDDLPLRRIVTYLVEAWKKADEKEKIWLEVQFRKSFSDYEGWVREFEKRLELAKSEAGRSQVVSTMCWWCRNQEGEREFDLCPHCFSQAELLEGQEKIH